MLWPTIETGKEILRRTMLTPEKLRVKRVSANIPGHAVCQRSGIPRSRLSDIERGYVEAKPEELERIGAAIDEIIQTRQHLLKVASEAGLSVAGVL
jgi:transcriptional regulator with XRE-family HTH domain